MLIKNISITILCLLLTVGLTSCGGNGPQKENPPTTASNTGAGEVKLTAYSYDGGVEIYWWTTGDLSKTLVDIDRVVVEHKPLNAADIDFKEATSEFPITSSNFVLRFGPDHAELDKMDIRLKIIKKNSPTYYSSTHTVQRKLLRPTALTTTIGIDRVDLSWKNNSKIAEKINVYRAVDPLQKEWVEIAALAPNVSNFTDFTSTEATRIAYMVSAVKKEDETKSSSTDSGMLPLHQPVITNIQEDGKGTIITWRNDSKKANKLKIFRFVDDMLSTQPSIADLPPTEQRFLDTAAPQGSAVYQIKVEMGDLDRTSPPYQFTKSITLPNINLNANLVKSTIPVDPIDLSAPIGSNLYFPHGNIIYSINGDKTEKIKYFEEGSDQTKKIWAHDSFLHTILRPTACPQDCSIVDHYFNGSEWLSIPITTTKLEIAPSTNSIQLMERNDGSLVMAIFTLDRTTYSYQVNLFSWDVSRWLPMGKYDTGAICCLATSTTSLSLVSASHGVYLTDPSQSIVIDTQSLTSKPNNTPTNIFGIGQIEGVVVSYSRVQNAEKRFVQRFKLVNNSWFPDRKFEEPFNHRAPTGQFASGKNGHAVIFQDDNLDNTLYYTKKGQAEIKIPLGKGYSLPRMGFDAQGKLWVVKRITVSHTNDYYFAIYREA